MSHQVFISYSTKDHQAAMALCSGLENEKISCWIAPRDVTVGFSWAQETSDAIAGARIFIIIFSTDYNASKQAAKEVEFAVSNNLNIIPVKIEDAQPAGAMAYYLAGVQFFDCISADIQSRIGELKTIIENALSA